jgi:hypothetical protein
MPIGRYFPKVTGSNPSTKAMDWSFLVALLPYIEQANIYQAFQQEFGDQTSLDLSYRVPVFYSPLDPTAPRLGASYAGNGSAFDRAINLNLIGDGTSNTVALGEHYSHLCGGPKIRTVPTRPDVPGGASTGGLQSGLGPGGFTPGVAGRHV